MLADTEVTFEALDLVVAAMERPASNAVVRWQPPVVRAEPDSKIHGFRDAHLSLVTAVKGFTHMDRRTSPEPVDLGPSWATPLRC